MELLLCISQLQCCKSSTRNTKAHCHAIVLFPTLAKGDNL